MHVDHDLLARKVSGLCLVEGEAGESVRANAVTIEKRHRAWRNLMCHRPVIPRCVQADDDNGLDISRNLFSNGSPKRAGRRELPAKERKMPVKVIVSVLFGQ